MMGTLRFISAIAVVIAHSSPLFGLEFMRGVSAVQGFYLVSGFLISMILHEKYSSGNGGLWLFYSNRALRIFPTYWATLFIAVLTMSAVTARWEEALPHLNWSTIGYVVWTNVGLFGVDSTLFVSIQNGALELTRNFANSDPPVYKLMFIPQSWTLGIELMVYLIAPFLFRRSIVILAAVAAASFLLRAVAFDFGYRDDPWTYRFVPFELGLFVLGSISYRGYRALHDSAVLTTLAPAAFVAMLVLSFAYPWLPQGASWLGGFTTAQVIYLGAVALMLPALFMWSRAHAFDRRLGDLSYPLYLCHMIVVSRCAPVFGAGNWIPAVGSVLLAILITYVVDDRVNRFRQARISGDREVPGGNRRLAAEMAS